MHMLPLRILYNWIDTLLTVTDNTAAPTGFLDNAPDVAGTGTGTINTIQIFDFDGDVEIELVGIESVTLNYDRDLDDLATISTDRAGVPIDGQVHVTISDFRLNLDPTAADVWYMNASSSSATYGTTEGTAATVDTAAIDSNALADTAEASITALITDWNVLFGGKGGKFTLADPMATISDIDVTGNRDG